MAIGKYETCLCPQNVLSGKGEKRQTSSHKIFVAGNYWSIVPPLMASALLAACSNPNTAYNAYRQGYSSYGSVAPPSNYNYATPARSAGPNGPYFTPVQPDFSAYEILQQQVHQPPYVASRPPQEATHQPHYSLIPSASAAETSPTRYPDPPVAADDGSKCGWWRLCNAWSGK